MNDSSLILVGCSLLATLSGCSQDNIEPEIRQTAIDGKWCGRKVASAADCTGDEVNFVELSQAGTRASAPVTGQWCEAYQKDCYPIEDGTASGTHLSAIYRFGDVAVMASFELRAPDQLEGTLFSTKCNCGAPVTLYRVP